MGMSWADFDDASGLERDMLLRALPLVPTQSSAEWRMRIDFAAPEPVRAQIAANDIIRATPDACVALLGIRPLLFGAAWKVLDLLLEEAFCQAGELPDRSRGYSVGQKGGLARSGAGRPGTIKGDIWRAITLTYDATRVLRDSLRSPAVSGRDNAITVTAGGCR